MEKVKLIEGEFTPTEAKEILLNMISSKIQFHTINDFSSDIRTGRPDTKSRERLAELRRAKEKITNFIKKAEKEGLLIDIQSSITLSCREEKKLDQL